MSDGTGVFSAASEKFPAFYVFRKSLIRFLCLDSPAKKERKRKIRSHGKPNKKLRNDW